MTHSALLMTEGDKDVLKQDGRPDSFIEWLQNDELTRLVAQIILSFGEEDGVFISKLPPDIDESSINMLGSILTIFFALKIMNPVRERNNIKCRTDTVILSDDESNLSNDDLAGRSSFSYKDKQFFFKPATPEYRGSLLSKQSEIRMSF